MAETLYWLFPWNFKEKGINHFLWHSLEKSHLCKQTGASRRPAENRKGPSLWRAASRSREMAQVGRIAGRMAGCAVICGSNP